MSDNNEVVDSSDPPGSCHQETDNDPKANTETMKVDQDSEGNNQAPKDNMEVDDGNNQASEDTMEVDDWNNQAPMDIMEEPADELMVEPATTEDAFGVKHDLPPKTPKSVSSRSRHFSDCLLSSIKGYTRHFVDAVGKSRNAGPGLVTSLRTSYGPLVRTSLDVKFTVSDESYTALVKTINIAIREDVTKETFDTLEDFHQSDVFKTFQVHSHNSVNVKATPNSQLPDTPIHVYTVLVEKSLITLGKTATLEEKYGSFLNNLDEFIDSLDNTYIHFALWGYEMIEDDWEGLQDIVYTDQPYIRLAGTGKNPSVKQLTWKKINETAPRPMHPLIPANYIDKDHHKVFQLTAIHDEVEYFRSLTAALEKIPCAVMMLPVGYWQAKNDDKKAFGIEAETACPTEFVVAYVPTEITRALMPEPGTAVSFRLPLKPIKRQLPEVEITPEIESKLFMRLLDGIRRCSTKACTASELQEEKNEKKKDNDSIDDQVWEDVLNDRAVSVLSDYPDVEPGKTIQSLLKRAKESDDDWHARLLKFVKEHAVQPAEPHEHIDGPEWKGHALAPIPGYPTSARFFRLYVPKQKHWPNIFERPPLNFEYGPMMTMKGQTRKFFEDINKQPKMAFAKITVHYNLQSIILEGEGMQRAHDMPELNTWMQYICKFDRDNFPKRDIFKEIKGMTALQKAFADKGDHENAAALDKFKSTVCGKIFISGPPGSGKSYFAQHVATAIIQSGVESEPEPDLPKVASMTHDQSTPIKVSRGKVAWLTPLNEQAGDATKRLTDAGHSVVRIYPRDKELEAMLREKPKELNELSKTKNSTLNVMIKHINSCDENAMHDRDPALDPYSLTSRAREYVKNNPRQKQCKQYNDYHKMTKADRKFDRDGMDAIKSIFKTVLSQADAYVSTPYAIYSVYHHLGGFPVQALVLDEAGRISEHFCVLAATLWPRVITLFCGDPKQFGPMSVLDMTANEKETGSHFRYHNTMKDVRKTAVITRAAANTGIEIVLKNVYRFYGEVAQWVSTRFYQGQMNVVNERITEQSGKICRTIMKMSGSNFSGSILWIEPRKASEQKIGTSYINEINASFVVHLAIQLLASGELRRAGDTSKRGSVLIASPYKQQVSQYHSVTPSQPKRLLPAKFFDFRTVDSTPSRESEVVILDLTRTDSINFVAKDDRLAVALTRARLLTIIVGDTRQASRNSHMRSLLAWCTEQDAVKSTWALQKFCQRCKDFGHEA